ncbi:hypothetical protein [Haladaptatus sp. R4]|uniref:hypothetical protein n=1 Tax=Haladaptatus sp. R4 TaxID=1679489 RepID=UPI000ABF4241|nr:hypothetical protein [Haladaptatus sp. R4]
MEDVSQPPTVEEVSELLDARAYDDVTACLKRFETAPADDRRGLSQELQRVGEETPDALAPVVPALVRFLTDAERSVRLTTAKTFVAVAKHESDAVALVVPALAERARTTRSSTTFALARPRRSATSPSTTRIRSRRPN